ncbi:MAG TPA: hypothetical protein VMV81_14150, partial [Phycisphaerae bacterium]|nr:hypothetical protein [Phycisphaerae bacterium]
MLDGSFLFLPFGDRGVDREEETLNLSFADANDCLDFFILCKFAELCKSKVFIQHPSYLLDGLEFKGPRLDGLGKR